MRHVLVSTLLLWSSQALAAPQDLGGRRAIRGAPVESLHETEELRAMREFDEANFDRGAGPQPGSDADAAPARTGLTGGLGPDALPAVLRSPTPLRTGAEPPAPAIPWLGQLKLPDMPVRLDARVIRYLEFYKNDSRGRAIMGSWLRKQGRWRALMDGALRRAGLPQALIYIAMIESGYDPHDRSHAGAVGLWQFMPEGGRIYGLRIDYWVDERKDPERATEAAMQYLADLKERFGGWPLALAGLNAGYGAVLRSMQKYNTNDYWELCRHEDGLPWETTLYVPKAMAAAIVGENRKLFGYAELPADPPFAFDRVSVRSSMSLAQIAHAAGVPVEQVAALNPELRRNRTPPDAWRARVPAGTGVRFTASAEHYREALRPYWVRFGERLEDVAREHGMTLRELRALDGIDDSGEIHPGMTLLVPEGKGPLSPPPDDGPVIVAVPDRDGSVAGKKRIFYRALPQDTVRDIAAFFGVGAAELTRWNNLDLDARLASKMVLQVWVAKEFDVSKAALVDASRVNLVTVGSPEFFDLVEARRGRKRLSYTVKKGDDWQRIGKKFGLKVADLERINRLGAAHSDLTVGQKLVVYVAMSASERAAAQKQQAAGAPAPPAPPAGSKTDKADDPDDSDEADPRGAGGDAHPAATDGRGTGGAGGDAHRTLPRPPPPDGRP